MCDRVGERENFDGNLCSRGILSEFNEIGGCEIRGSMQFRCGLNMYEVTMTRLMVKMRRSWDVFCGLEIWEAGRG
jgi:hypothetical protein